MTVTGHVRAHAIVLILAMGIVGCSDSSSNRGGGQTITITTSAVPSGQLGVAYSATVATDATSGQTLTWTLRGNLPTGLNAVFSNTDAVISGTPAAVGSFTFELEVNDGGTGTKQSFTVVVTSSATVVITTSSLPAGTVGSSYNQGITATGGSGSGYTWGTSNGSLPPGLSLTDGTPSALLSGTPTSAGVFTFDVDVTDSAGQTDVQTLTITINTVGTSPLDITTTTLPGGVVGVPYDEDITAQDGTGVGYTWSTSSGALPTGLSLTDGTPSANLAGDPTASGTFTFDLTVTDSGSDTDTESYSVTINPAIDITTTSLPDGVLNGAYSETVTAQDGSGSGYSWQLSGSVPNGFSITSSATPSATISGPPTATGTFTFDVTVTDDAGSTDTQSFTVTINPALEITTTSVANATVGASYSETVSATGGSGSGYDWSLSGNVPPGLTVTDATPDGTLNGPITSAGTFTFDLTVEDSDGNIDTQSLTLTATAAPSDPVRLATFVLPNGRINEAYSVEIEARDGAASSPTFSVSAGSLPTGLSLTQPTGGDKTLTISGTPTVSGTFTYTIEVDDGSSTADHEFVTTIAVAPRWIVYRADIPTSLLEELYAVDISSGTPGAPINLTGGLDVASDFEYRFSWDGSQLAYIAGGDLYIQDMSTATPGPAVQLNAPTVHTSTVFAFQFSNDDRWIVFTEDGDNDVVNELYAVDISGGAPFPAQTKISGTPISGADVIMDDLDPTVTIPGMIYGSNTPSTFGSGTFSPNGRWFCYSHDNLVDNETDLWVVDFSSGTPSAPQRVATNTRVAGADMDAFQWSMDSNWLLFTADFDNAGVDELYLADVNSLGVATQVSAEFSDPTNSNLDVLTGTSYYLYFSFAPDLSSIVYRADATTSAQNDLFFVSLAGGTPAPAVQINPTLPTGGDIDGFLYSADGRYVAYRGDTVTDNDSELYVVDVADGVLGNIETVTHTPIPSGADVVSFSVTDRNIMWAGSSHIVYLSDTVTDNDTQVYAVDVTGGMPFPAPVQLNATLPSGADAATIGVLPDNERVVLIGDMNTDGNQELFLVSLSSPGTNTVVFATTTPGLEPEDAYDNDAGCFHSPDLRYIGALGDFFTTSAEDLQIVDISGTAPFPAPQQVNNPSAVSSSIQVESFIFYR